MKPWPSALGTTAVVAIYLFTFIAVLLTDQLPGIPDPTPQGLNLSEAWQDLHILSARPHPYNSHANDLMHAYLLARLAPIAAAYPHVHIVEDRVSNASYEQIYFEGTNILVKVDGTEVGQHGAVLFSAHYDSVSTSAGAIDDGVAIVSMLQFVEKLAKKRTKRSAIFNFNNGEEDGLNGARVFLEHPWSNLTETFLNLEGAGSGGRPVLFRGTSTKPLSAFLHNHVPHPHGTILAADAFSAGVLRSRTDYSIYAENGGMQGLDLAFYKGRSYYHTKYDAISFIRGGTRALWSMMEALEGAGYALLDQDNSESPGDVVYFDLFGHIMVMFSLATMQAFNFLFLVAAPIIIVGLTAWRRLLKTRTSDAGILHRVWHGEGKHDLSWLRFWIGLTSVVVLQAALVVGYLASNKYIVYSSPYVVIGSAISLVYLAFFASISSFLHHYPASASDPNTLLLQLVLFTYIVLLSTTTFVPIGGTYLFTALAACAFFGWVVGVINDLVDEAHNVGQSETVVSEQRGDEEPSETTPLIHQSTLKTASRSDERRRMIWFLQLILVVPMPLILVSHIGVLLLGAMPQGIVDGTPVFIVYSAISLVATLLILPVAPFMASYPPIPPLPTTQPLRHLNSPKMLFRAVMVIFVATAAYTSGFLGVVISPISLSDARLGFPFSIDAPMKTFFQQRVELIAPWITQESDPARSYKTQSITSLTGVPYYLERMIVPSLPSAFNNDAECIRDEDRKGLIRCSWSSGDNMLPSPGKGASSPDGDILKVEPHTQMLPTNPWLQSSIYKASANTLRIQIRGTNTRTCRIYIDNAKVAQWNVDGGTPGAQKRYETQKGSKLTLWSRTWDKKFVVEATLDEAPEKIKGRVACEWAEYESGRVGMNDTVGSSIPAYEEALLFFPRWATLTLTKVTDLVEVWSAFEV